MKHRLLNLLSILSLLLCVAVCVLWLRSQWHLDFVLFRAAGDLFRLQSASGTLKVEWGDDWPDPVPVKYVHNDVIGRWDPADDIGAVAGFGFARTVQRWEYRQGQWHSAPFVNAAVPHWLVAALAGAVPAWRAARLRNDLRGRKRAAAGQCPSCGYDLRATPGRCPECGAVPASKEAA